MNVRINYLLLIFYSTDLTRKATRITNKPVNLYAVLTKYHEFGDILSKTKAETLVPHHLYNLQIKLEDG